MGNKKQERGFLGRLLRSINVGGAVAVLSLVAVVGWAAMSVESLTYDPKKNMLSLDQSDWGAEVFDAIHDSAIAQGLVRPANACGLGASSCFRCHNGRRAPEPSADLETSPWHVQHARVNNSCAGCHSGNPRLMREQMAHTDLIANPLGSPNESCASCHRSASELDEFLTRYLGVAGQ